MIRELLTNKTAKEKAQIKGCEIAKLNHKGKFLRGELEVEITDLKAIDGGVEVLARAWKNGKQLGFGKDGSVDIERFRIQISGAGLNGNLTHLVVSDPVGDIEVEYTDEHEQRYTKRYREDPQENLLRTIEHIVSIVGKDGSNIVAGKVGNTTSTFNPEPASGTAPIDGYVGRVDAAVSESFSSVRGGAGNNNDESSTLFILTLQASATTDEFTRLRRLGVGFNTSSIGTDSISSATLSIHSRTAGDGGGGSTGLGDTDADIVSFTPAAENTFENTDYAVANFGSTRFATGIALSTLVASGDYNDFALNASGLSYIDTTGNTMFGVRLKWDVDNSFGGSWSSGAATIWVARTVDEADSTEHPKLVVEHSVAAEATGNFFAVF